MRLLTFQDNRHTGNYLASKSGASTRELMHRIGNGSMRAAPIYQHATDARSQEIADRLNDVVARENQPDDEDGAPGGPGPHRLVARGPVDGWQTKGPVRRFVL